MSTGVHLDRHPLTESERLTIACGNTGKWQGEFIELLMTYTHMFKCLWSGMMATFVWIRAGASLWEIIRMYEVEIDDCWENLWGFVARGDRTNAPVSTGLPDATCSPVPPARWPRHVAGDQSILINRSRSNRVQSNLVLTRSVSPK